MRTDSWNLHKRNVVFIFLRELREQKFIDIIST